MSVSTPDQLLHDEDSAALFANDYWLETRRPLVCLMFLAPLLLVYELGVLTLASNETGTLRNGADYWMRTQLTRIGFGQALLLPALILGGLLVWHLASKEGWKFSGETLKGMLAESLLFAFLLMFLGQLLGRAFGALSLPAQQIPLLDTSGVAHSISYIGAGIYEEFLFRLCLLPLFYQILKLGMSSNWAMTMAVLVSSVVFSLAHYIGPAGDQFSYFSMTFRTTAGIFFSALFFLRGFGITVGCHATYDLLVGVILVDG